MRSRLARLRPATDNELLLFEQLELAPDRRAPSAVVRRLRFLDDQALPSFFSGARQHLAAVIERDFTEAHEARVLPPRADALLQSQAPRRQRPAAEVLAAIAQEIEQDEGCRLLVDGTLDVRGAGQVDASLNMLKPEGPAFAIDGDDFSVQDHGARTGAKHPAERHDDLGELRSLVEPIPGVEPDILPAFHLDDGPDSVVFGLVHQPGRPQRRLCQRCEHRAEDRRLRHPRSLVLEGRRITRARDPRSLLVR